MSKILTANLPSLIIVGDQLKQKERKMTTVTDEDEYIRDMDENLQLPQKHLLPTQQLEENQNKRRKLRSWFSDLDDDQLMAIFGGGLRFEICRGFLTYKVFRRHNLFGTIQVAAAANSPDPLFQNAFDVFNRESNDPKPISFTGDLPDLDYISLPVSSTSVFHIAAKLFLTSDKVDGKDNLGDDYDCKPAAANPVDEITVEEFNSWILQELVARGAICVDNVAECVDNGAECIDNGTECVDSGAESNSWTIQELIDKSWTIQELVDNGAECVDTRAECADTGAECVVNEAEHVCNEVLQCCNDHWDIDFLEFSNKPNGGSGSCKLQGKDGSLELYYVAVRYAVDADLEVKFCLNSKETKVGGCVVARYGEDFDYADSYTPWEVMLFDFDSAASVTPGNLNLNRSVLAVPAKSSLIITAELYDSTSSDLILYELSEFRVPLDFQSSHEELLGEGCSLVLKVNWKQPCEELKIICR